MRRLQWLLCGVVLAIGGCATAPADETTAAAIQDETDLQQAQTIFRSQALPVPADETCTETDGACHVGQCELGPHDMVQLITEVCCTPDGSCTTEHYRLCGC